MRSRYSAYYLSNAKYIIKTTHPLNVDFQKDAVSWEKDILEFSKNYTFEKTNNTWMYLKAVNN